MKKPKKNVPLILGAVLVVITLGIFAGLQLQSFMGSRKAERLASQVQQVLPERRKGTWDDREDIAMPVIRLEGEDVCALVEFPGYGVMLPVIAAWDSGKITATPCRYYGSVYDNTLIIGGSDLRGQLDFFDRLDIGDSVWITDMTGAEYTYRVRIVERTKHAEADNLLSDDALTLFVRQTYGQGYLLVRCEKDI